MFCDENATFKDVTQFDGENSAENNTWIYERKI
jgi:hypothetical protein